MRPLTLYALFVIAAMVAVSAWATLQIPIMPVVRDLLAQPDWGNNPWFVATLFDAYFGFLWFWLWIAYRERGTAARAGWLAGLLLLGNIAMAAYVLLALRKLPPGAGLDALLKPA